jgi:hypothetical protein
MRWPTLHTLWVRPWLLLGGHTCCAREEVTKCSCTSLLRRRVVSPGVHNTNTSSTGSWSAGATYKMCTRMHVQAMHAHTPFVPE